MKIFLRRFKTCFKIFGILLAVWFGILALHSIVGVMRHNSRQNTECTTTERVFDYADVLTDKEEEKLRELIAKREKQTGCDIVLVILNESLEEYGRSYKDYVSYDDYVTVYADNFYDDHKFGYNKPWGNGVLYLDNLYREADGWAYSHFTTTGTAEEKYSSAAIDHLLEKTYRWSKVKPYYGYKACINQFYHDMNGMDLFNNNISVPALFFVSLIAAVVYVISNLGSKAGEKTVTSATYVKDGKVKMNRKTDKLIRKKVTHHRIKTESSSGRSGGGGGHHTSSGGVSHGGGSHRH